MSNKELANIEYDGYVMKSEIDKTPSYQKNTDKEHLNDLGYVHEDHFETGGCEDFNPEINHNNKLESPKEPKLEFRDKKNEQKRGKVNEIQKENFEIMPIKTENGARLLEENIDLDAKRTTLKKEKVKKVPRNIQSQEKANDHSKTRKKKFNNRKKDVKEPWDIVSKLNSHSTGSPRNGIYNSRKFWQSDKKNSNQAPLSVSERIHLSCFR